MICVCIGIGGEPVIEEIDTPPESKAAESKPAEKGATPRKRKGKKVRARACMRCSCDYCTAICG